MRQTPWARHGRALLFAAAATVSCLGTAACISPRNTLGTNSSPCFRAIPVASEAVQDRGKLVGARLLGVRSLHRRLEALLVARAPTVKTVCVVAFHGRYRIDQVQRPFGPAPVNGTGIYAIVAVSVPQNRLIGTVVLSFTPLPLRHEVLRPPPGAGPPHPPGEGPAASGYVA
jgi:hypothetical protein